MKLQPFQLLELREISERLVQSKHWNELPWDNAWRGEYPSNATDAEIEQELLIIIKKVVRIVHYGVTKDDFDSTQDYLRTIAIKSCRSLKCYQAINFL